MSKLKKLKEATSLSDLAYMLDYKPSAMAFIIYKIPPENKYYTFQIPKKNGGVRDISVPTEKLKQLQSRLYGLLNECMAEQMGEHNSRHSLSHGFKKGHSIKTNAYRHRRKRYVFNIDLKDFFPSINFGRVRGFFIHNKNFRLHPKVATTIAQIACHDNCLPQGSPCSPIISDYIAHSLDTQLYKLAKKHNAIYSRYADDISISTNEKFFPRELSFQDRKNNALWCCGKNISEIVTSSGFSINLEKTRMQLRSSRQTVTGVVVNSKLNVASEYWRYTRQMCHSLFRSGSFYIRIERPPVKEDEIKIKYSKKILFLLKAYLKSLMFWKKQMINNNCNVIKSTVTGSFLSGHIDQLDGILSHIYNIKQPFDDLVEHAREHPHDKDNPKVKKHTTAFEKLYASFLFFKHFHALEKPLIICEGKTDYVYLKCALRSLQSDYPELITKENDKFVFKIKFFNFTANIKKLLITSEGASGLGHLITVYMRYMKQFYCSGRQYPVILILDDDRGFNKIKNIINSQYGANTFSNPQAYYRIVSNLYIILIPKLAGQVEAKIEHCFTQETLQEELNGKTLNLENTRSDTINKFSKHYFAEQIVLKKQSSIDFSGFKPIFEAITNVAEHHRSQTS